MTEKLELNLQVIAEEAEQNWADNWNFRAYLQQNIEPTEIDETVIFLNVNVSNAIDCTACGNCCREIYPHMESTDISRLALKMNISIDQLMARLKIEEDLSYSFCEKPCPLLQDNKCTVYTDRPDDCREYPHLHQPDFLGNSIGTIENYRVCPIVFNVYNQLKMKFNYDNSVDYIGASDPEA